MRFLCGVKSKSKRELQKENDKVVLQNLLDFAEGRLSTEQFWELYKNDINIRNLLIKNKKRPWGYDKFILETGKFTHINKPSDSIYEFNPDNLLEKINIDKLQHRYELFVVVNQFFISRKIIITHYNNDVQKYLFLVKMLPSWLAVNDVSFLQDVLASAPNDLTQIKKIAWCRTKIRELFKYDKKPPDWIQSPEWPIVDNLPYVFSGQESSKDGFERYCFYNPNNKEQQITIEQCE